MPTRPYLSRSLSGCETWIRLHAFPLHSSSSLYTFSHLLMRMLRCQWSKRLNSIQIPDISASSYTMQAPLPPMDSGYPPPQTLRKGSCLYISTPTHSLPSMLQQLMAGSWNTSRISLRIGHRLDIYASHVRPIPMVAV